MQEPFHDEVAGTTRGQRLSDTYKEIRERALSLPKFGTSTGAENKDIQNITRLVDAQVIQDVQNFFTSNFIALLHIY